MLSWELPRRGHNGPEDVAWVVKFDGPFGLAAVAVSVVGCHDDVF